MLWEDGGVEHIVVVNMIKYYYCLYNIHNNLLLQE